jgi:hypothetical protein
MINKPLPKRLAFFGRRLAGRPAAPGLLPDRDLTAREAQAQKIENAEINLAPVEF